MKVGRLGTRAQLYLWVILAMILVFAVVKWRGGPAPSSPSAPAGSVRAADPPDEPAPRRGAGARQGKTVSPEDVPIITQRDLEPPPGVRDRQGRNIFDFRAPTAPPPPNPTPAPPPPPAPGSPAFVGPLPPPPPTPTPAPPEIPFKFIGTFGPKERPIAVLVAGDQAVNARAGEVVFDRFILRRVGYESVDIGFVGFAPSETRRVGITP